MYKFLHITSAILLLFTGITAISGGVALVIDTTGETIQFPQEARDAIHNSIFGSFLIPGLCLMLLIGVAAIVVAIGALKKSALYPYGLLYMGTALLIWLSVQLVFIEDRSPLQVLYGVLGLIFIFIAVAIKNNQ